MQTLIFTLLGQDKPGLVDSLAQQIYALDGNWLASNFASMAGHFAGFVEVQVPNDKQQAIIDAFAQHPDLTIQLVNADTQLAQSEQIFTLEVVGNDRSGILQAVSAVLSAQKLNIVRLDSGVEPAPNWGSNLFKAVIQISVSPSFDQDGLQNALEDIADDITVDMCCVSKETKALS